MAINIKNREDGFTKLLHGMECFVNTLKVTFGPLGRHVALQKSGERPQLTRMGAEVSADFELPDSFQNMGVSLMREMALATHKKAGDGSVMSTLIAVELIKDLSRLALNHSIVDLGKGLRSASDSARASLIASAKPARTSRQMSDLMTTSVGGAVWVVEPVLKVLKKLGAFGVVTFSDSDSIENELTFQKGFTFDKSLISPYFDDPCKEFAELDDARILICADTIHNMEDVLRITEKVVEQDRPLLIIADKIGEEALSLLILNKNNGTLNCLAVKAPGFGAGRIDLLEDIAAFTGGKVFGDSLGISLASVMIDDLGRARKIRVERSRTIIMEGKGAKSRIAKRVKELKARMARETLDYEKQTLDDRTAKMTAGVANIGVGGYTERDRALRRVEITQAYAALRAGVGGGVIHGGGIGLLMTASELAGEKRRGAAHSARRALARALSAPFCALVDNSGASGPYMQEKIIDGGFKLGYNVATRKLEKLSSWSVIDPVTTVLAAIESAVSLAVTVMSSEVFIADEPYIMAPDENP
ncbi:Heat shock protein 60 family chaperone GroEL, partial [hydrothermal vent metagenome]